jgi:hypothetical protein
MELSLFNPPTTHFISYTDGTSGLLLKALLERTVLSYMPFEDFATNDVNSAHGSSSYANYKMDIPDGDIMGDLTAEFNSIAIVDPERSAFIALHYFDPAGFKTRFPGSKTAVVTHTAQDIEEVTINWVYKATPPNQPEGSGLRFNKLSPCAQVAFDDVSDRDFFTLTHQQRLKVIEYSKGITIMRAYHLLGDISQYGQDVVEFKYQDLMTNPQVVNQQIQALTGLPMTESALAALSYYQGKQQTFMTQVRGELGL